MKPLESQLRAKIEKECSEIYTPDDLRGSHFVDGAHFLLPLVLKLYEALSHYADPENYNPDKNKKAAKSASTGNICHDILLWDLERNFKDGIDMGGKRARAAIAEIERELK